LANCLFKHFNDQSFKVNPAKTSKDYLYAITHLRDILDRRDSNGQVIGQYLYHKLFNDYIDSPLQIFKDYTELFKHIDSIPLKAFSASLQHALENASIDKILESIKGLEDIFFIRFYPLPSDTFRSKADLFLKSHAKEVITSDRYNFLTGVCSLDLSLKIAIQKLTYRNQKTALEQTLADKRAHKRDTEFDLLAASQKAVLEKKRLIGFEELQHHFSESTIHLEGLKSTITRLDRELADLKKQQRTLDAIYPKLLRQKELFRKDATTVVSFKLKLESLKRNKEELTLLLKFATQEQPIPEVHTLSDELERLKKTPVTGGMLGDQKRLADMQIADLDRAIKLLEKFPPLLNTPKQLLATCEKDISKVQSTIAEMERLGCISQDETQANLDRIEELKREIPSKTREFLETKAAIVPRELQHKTREIAFQRAEKEVKRIEALWEAHIKRTLAPLEAEIKADESRLPHVLNHVLEGCIANLSSPVASAPPSDV
jgi:hypothetical protein